MRVLEAEFREGLAALRAAVLAVLPELSGPLVPAAAAPLPSAGGPAAAMAGRLLSEAAQVSSASPGAEGSDADQAVASTADEAEASRLIALVELARGGDADAFGMLYDHYHTAVYRFCYYRVGSVSLAEDLMSETFLRAMRAMSSFRWQGKDFGAWLMTIARNLTADHFKAARTRLERPTDDMAPHDVETEGPERSVLASLTNQALLAALNRLPTEQHECLVLRFLQGLSIAETAHVLGRSDGAIKQLQLRGVRNLAKLLPEGLG
jgi:RNA polymerase sigma-70 factor (ECF subfamily)